MNGCDQQVKPVLETFSDKITFLGPAGSGHLVKALNNALLAGQNPCRGPPSFPTAARSLLVLLPASASSCACRAHSWLTFTVRTCGC